MEHHHGSKGSISIQVKFLDESVTGFRVQYKALGKWLLEQVCGMLSIIEVDYFGLVYYDSRGTQYWLDAEKPMYRQLSLDLDHPILYFGVKFYNPDPSKLEDELTRYLFCLQIKRDLSDGSLNCNENIAALIASYVIQSELGDYNPDEFVDAGYISTYTLIPHQDAEFEYKTMEYHKKHVGLSPAESDYLLLETASKLDYYGVKLTPVKGSDGVPLNISVNHVGVLIFQNLTKISSFLWSRIHKLSFKRKKFLMKLHDDDIVEFIFETRNESKNFWKKCIEQHTFFRCTAVKPIDANRKSKLLTTRGSSFRYSGRTQQQVLDYVRTNIVRRQPFQRTTSFLRSASSNIHHQQQQQRSSASCSSLLHPQSIQAPPHFIDNPTSHGASSHRDAEYASNNRQIRSLSVQDYQSSNVRRDYDADDDEDDAQSDDGRQLKSYHDDVDQEVYDKLRMDANSSSKDADRQSSSAASKGFNNNNHRHYHVNGANLNGRRMESEDENLNEEDEDQVDDEEEDENNNLRFMLNEEYVKDLKASVIGMDKILEEEPHKNRYFQFIRQGCLLKLSRKGYQKRMFFLFKGMLVYCTRSKSSNKFKVHGNLILESNVMIEETDVNSIPITSAIPIQPNAFGFTIYAGDRALMVASTSQNSREDWIRAISSAEGVPLIAITNGTSMNGMEKSANNSNGVCKNGSIDRNGNMSDKLDDNQDLEGSFAKEILSQIESVLNPNYSKNDLSKDYGEVQNGHPMTNGANGHDNHDENHTKNTDQSMNENCAKSIKESISSCPSNFNPFSVPTLTNLCWDRDSMITFDQYVSAYTTNLSGYLLRKFKSSAGWQRLYVTFKHFSLYFYKSHEDTDAIANLPLLGYKLCLPSQEDEDVNVHKKLYVFKLYFKSHIYYFRTEDEDSFYLWMDALSTCCK